MGKFDGILICSDVDGTLIDDNFKIPKCNLEAIEYFKSEGGLFTLSTGRTPQGVHLYLDEVRPNAPLVCQNGAAIYDCKEKRYLWSSPIENYAYDIVDYVIDKFPDCGVEVLCESGVYFPKRNYSTDKHASDEEFTFIEKDYREIMDPWLKIIFAEEKTGADEIQTELQNSAFAEKYQLVRSYATYYEVLEKSTNKGRGVNKLIELLGIKRDNVIVIGDNDNDAYMLLAVENSYVVKNASSYAKECARFVLEVDNNEGALAFLIEKIEKQLV